MRIVTINTGKGDGLYARRLELLAEGLGALVPDVVALQEAFAVADGSADTAAFLAQRLGLHVTVAPARRKLRWVDGRQVQSNSSVALLSREPLLETQRWPLPSHPDDGQRVALLVRLPLGVGVVMLANVHLTHLPGLDSLRREQISTLLAHPWFATHGSVGHLIVGDLNTDLDRVPALFGDVRGWSIQDAYAVANGALPRTTCPVTASGRQGRCLDYILSLTQPPRAHPSFAGAHVVLAQPDAAGIYPSDHRGVMVSLQVR
jgi:endonuclease/exonuclease/phosphatase family metal-dependent hydrolase